jgi:hypothetical protein
VDTLTKRELVRNPARASALAPGESLAITDGQGGLVVSRPKRVTISPAEMETELQRLCAGGPATDALAMMEDEA